MKRLLSFCAAALMSISVFAQYAVDTTSLSEPRLLKSRGCRIYVGEEKLNKNEAAAYFSDLGGKDRSADYLSYRKAYNTGVGLTIAGLLSCRKDSLACKFHHITDTIGFISCRSGHRIIME